MPSPRNIAWMGLVAAFLFCIAGAAFLILGNPLREPEPRQKPLSYEELTGSLFLTPAANPLRPPDARELAVPTFVAATSVWGATGRDLEGRIWIGVSASGTGTSAHLYQYTPGVDTWRDCGSVVDKLKAAGRYRDGEGQIKIHSRIVLAGDGWLYFASTDEEGEEDDGTVLPRWGGHLWRVNPDDCHWQHLKAVPEGLVAILFT